METTAQVQDRLNAAPESVRRSSGGCQHCLWAGIECKFGSLYQERMVDVKRGRKTVSVPSCNSYTYND